jgi:MFS family permease
MATTVVVDQRTDVRTGAIFLASFLTLIAAGIGFAVRGAILGDWGAQFGFTKSELGSITGGGLAGFGITIIICSLFADRVGYRALLMGAFVLHVLSAILTLAATPVFNASGKDATYWTLYVGMFMFALGNGLCEAAINPLVATLYPKQKTHYLNILHAGWPAGLVIGALVAFLFAGETAFVTRLRWEILIATFLIPAVWYGLIVLKERFPRSETHAAGVTIGEQISAALAPMFIFLILIHAMVGYVELGTDSWITNILNNVVGSFSLLLFIYVSLLMTGLRFFAGPIVHRINPLGLLFISAVLGAVGLFMLGTFKTAALLVVASTIFALGKTFYWPTMLGVAGERFPRTGALGMGLLGGFGMLSAGFLGGPGIGYKQDRNASAYLQTDAKLQDVYGRFKSEKPNHFLFFKEITGLNAAKVAVLDDNAGALKTDIAALEKSGKKLADDKNLSGLYDWWYGTNATATKAVAIAVEKAKADTLSQGAAADVVKKADDAATKARTDTKGAPEDIELAALSARAKALADGATPEKAKAAADAANAAETSARTAAGSTGLGALAYAQNDRPMVKDATIYGGQQALKITAAVPVTMAVCYLLLVLYFVSKGGYKQVHMHDDDHPDTRPGEKYTGGVEGPVR